MIDLLNKEKLNTDETFSIIQDNLQKNGIVDKADFYAEIRNLSKQIGALYDSDIAMQFENDMLIRWTLQDEAINNLDKFHLMNASGKISGVFDYSIFEDIKKNTDMFVMGGMVYIYENGCYFPDESGAKIKTMIRAHIHPQFIKSNTIKRIYDLFLTDSELEATFDNINQYPSHWINFKNGMYDPKGNSIHKHCPEYRCINQIPHEYFPTKEHGGKYFDKWFSFAIPNEKDREMVLQYVGLLATKDTSFQKFMLLCGEGGTGKSTLLRMCELFIGTRNTSNISLVELNQRFASFGLMGKLLNSCADLEIEALQDVSVIKKCLGEDSLRGEQKGRDAISFKNYAKLIFSTNELPFVKNEKSNGFFRRLLILEMNQTPDKQDAELFVKLAGDMQHFIELTMEALRRLYAAGCITESENSRKAVERMRCDSDTVEAFLRDKCTRAGRTARKVLYEEYEKYCDETERQSVTAHTFYKSMRLKRFAEKTINGIIHFDKVTVLEADGFVEVGEGAELPFD